jgi:DNA excision repair protein ERCC-2
MYVKHLPRKVSKYFPYEHVRPYQGEFMKTIFEALKAKQHVCIEGPAGLGKTIAALSAVLPVAEERDYVVLFCTRTHREADRVIEELKAIASKKEVGGLALRGRRDSCLHKLITHHQTDPLEAMEVCEQLKETRDCRFFEKLKEREDLVHSIQKRCQDKPITAMEINEICKREGICPYEVSKILVGSARVISLSYIYLFDTIIRQHFLRYLTKGLDETIIILDEAHNVPEVALEVGSDHLTLFSIRRAYREARKHGYDRLFMFCKMLEGLVEEWGEEVVEEEVVDPVAFLDEVEKWEGDVSFLLEYLREGARQVKARLLREGKFPRSYLSRVSRFLFKWVEHSDDPSFTFLLTKYVTGRGNVSLKLEIVSLDPRTTLKHVLSNACLTVSMSGTMEPMECYESVTGLPDRTTKRSLPSPFPRENVLCLLCKGVSTLFKKREAEMYEKICKKCTEIIDYTPANVGIFTASYEVLEGMLDAGFEGIVSKPLLCERADMSSKENERLISTFKSYARKGGAVLLGVQGGRSSEGVDYPGKTMQTSVIVGVPYAKLTPRIEAQIRFYERLFPGKGRELGYVLPAMKKASQAAGRPIRSLEDRGVMVFLDYRFSTAYCKRFLPRWMRLSAKTVPDEDGAIAKELVLFFGL